MVERVSVEASTIVCSSPQAISAARGQGFNAESVARFFEKERDKNNYLPHRLFNVDETGITVVQHKK